MLQRLGAWVARHCRLVLACWAVVAVAGAVIGGGIYDRTVAVDGTRPGLESTEVEERLDRLVPEGDTVVAVIGGGDLFSTGLLEQFTRAVTEIRGIDGVAKVGDPYTGGGPAGGDGATALVDVELQRDLDEDETVAVADRVAEVLRTIDAPQVLVGGEVLAERSFADQAVEDTVRGELVALVFLCVALLLVLGGARAASLPLAAAVAVIAATLLALTALAGTVAVSEYAVNIVTLLGIGLAVDYSLVMVFRYREEAAADRRATVETLLSRTTATAGRAVVVSGLAVGTAMTGLVVLADPLLSAMALGGALVVALATVAGLTLVPALVAVAHRHVPARGRRTWVWRAPARGGGSARTGGLARLARFAQRRPVAVTVAVVGSLLVLGVPLLQLELASSDERALPPGSEARQAAELIEEEFDEGALQPLTVLVDGDPAVEEVQALLVELGTLPGADGAFVREDLDGVTWLEVVPRGEPDGPAAQDLVRAVRASDSLPLQVGGPAAELVDAKAATADRLPVALALIVLATIALLLVLTGSVVVPVKALLLNLLTLTATLGVLVAVFQWGWGSGLLGFEPWGALDLTTPLLLLVLVFGLSMDYEVFLLSRIKEEWDRRRDDSREANDRAVLAGITATGPVVTAAAVCIGIVFCGFAVGELVAVKEVGVGMSVAVLLDVTVVRGLLLPAVMSLLGRWNWWRPFRPPAPPLPAPARPGNRGNRGNRGTSTASR